MIAWSVKICRQKRMSWKSLKRGVHADLSAKAHWAIGRRSVGWRRNIPRGYPVSSLCELLSFSSLEIQCKAEMRIGTVHCWSNTPKEQRRREQEKHRSVLKPVRRRFTTKRRCPARSPRRTTWSRMSSLSVGDYGAETLELTLARYSRSWPPPIKGMASTSCSW